MNIRFNAVLTNELEVAMMGEDKVFELQVEPTGSAPYVVGGLSEEALNQEIAQLVRQLGR